METADYQKIAHSPRTILEYEGDWKDFTEFCDANARKSIPAAPETIAAYIASRAPRHRVSTIKRRLCAIKHMLAVNGIECDMRAPVVRNTLLGVQRHHGSEQDQKDAITPQMLRNIIAQIEGNYDKVHRDRALILMAFAGAFRRSEICNLKRSQLKFDDRGVTVHLPKSKTDQLGRGRYIGVPYIRDKSVCPVTALEVWLKIGCIDEDDYIFRSFDCRGEMGQKPISTNSFVGIIKTLVRRHYISTGLSKGEADELASKYSGHSFRAGFVTAAAEGGAPDWQIAMQTGHKSMDILKRYIRKRCVFANNPMSKIEL